MTELKEGLNGGGIRRLAASATVGGNTPLVNPPNGPVVCGYLTTPAPPSTLSLTSASGWTRFETQLWWALA